MKTATDKTVASIVIQYPAAIPLFEGLKIDYCCGGQKPLGDACAAVGVPVEKVLASLEKISAASTSAQDQNWAERSLAELIEFLVEKHHTFTRGQLALLEKLSEKVARVHGQNHPELLDLRKLFQRMSADLQCHLMKEEQMAFPYLLELEKSKKTGIEDDSLFPFEAFQSQPLRVLMADHEEVGKQLREARRLTADFTPPEGACVTFQAFYKAFLELEEDLHRHIHLENNVLFPMAEKLAGDMVASL
jgi:regulator of cell morphogenesis and NO signaling